MVRCVFQRCGGMQVENRILEGPRDNLHTFLLAVDQLQKNVEFFTLNRTFKSSDNALTHARGLLGKAMTKIEEEFKHLLTIHRLVLFLLPHRRLLVTHLLLTAV